MATTGPNLYEVLGIAPGASAAEIKAAYRKQARKTHPDVAGSGMNGLYLMVQHAHEVLSDSARRREYDRSMDGAFSEPTEPPPPRTAADESPAGDPPRSEWVAGEQVPEGHYRGPLPREGHDLSKMPWIDKFDGVDRSTVTITRPGLLRWQFMAIGAAAAAGSMALTAVAQMAVLPVGLGLLGMVLIWAFQRIPRRLAVLIGVLVLLAVIMQVFSGAAGSTTWLVRIGAILGSMGLIGVLWWAVYALRVRERLLVSQKDIAQFFSWGEPGGGLAGAERTFGLDNTMDGIEGERLTAAEIAYFLGSIPGVRLVNGLAFPGSENADVDHAVICGSRIAFVDSKAWKPATYATVEGQDAIRVQVGEGWSYFPSHMSTAVERYREIIGGRRLGAGIRAYTVVHPKSTAAPLVLLNDGEDESVRLVTTQALIEELGTWFCEVQEQAVTVDRSLLSHLVAWVR